MNLYLVPDPPSDWIEPWSDQEGRRRVLATFADRFEAAPTVVATAPGRVNLIGEHTDYNDGLCLPLALPHAAYAAVAPRDDGQVVVATGLQDAPWTGALADLGHAQGWAAYAAGVAWALAEAGHPTRGFEMALESTVPLGAGLSSSAALECASGAALMGLLGIDDTRETRLALARAGIRAENEVAGAATGGMDQTVAVLASADHALLLDCRSWETRPIPFDPAGAGLDLLVVDTGAHHELNDGGYASRRADCEAAVAALGVASLREATEDQVATLDDQQVRRRARHVVTEIARVAACADALQAGEWPRVGELMRESHASMRDDFEISCPELDLTVETTLGAGALGARMTGGGFGGSAIALVDHERLEETVEAVRVAFDRAGFRDPTFLPAPASAAAHLL